MEGESRGVFTVLWMLSLRPSFMLMAVQEKSASWLQDFARLSKTWNWLISTGLQWNLFQIFEEPNSSEFATWHADHFGLFWGGSLHVRAQRGSNWAWSKDEWTEAVTTVTADRVSSTPSDCKVTMRYCFSFAQTCFDSVAAEIAGLKFDCFASPLLTRWTQQSIVVQLVRLSPCTLTQSDVLLSYFSMWLSTRKHKA